MYECSLQQHVYSKWKDTENTAWCCPTMELHKIISEPFPIRLQVVIIEAELAVVRVHKY